MNGQPLGEANNYWPYQGPESVQFDTRAYAGQGTSNLRLELTGAPLHCFDFRRIP